MLAETSRTDVVLNLAHHPNGKRNSIYKECSYNNLRGHSNNTTDLGDVSEALIEFDKTMDEMETILNRTESVNWRNYLNWEIMGWNVCRWTHAHYGLDRLRRFKELAARAANSLISGTHWSTKEDQGKMVALYLKAIEIELKWNEKLNSAAAE